MLILRARKVELFYPQKWSGDWNRIYRVVMSVCAFSFVYTFPLRRNSEVKKMSSDSESNSFAILSRTSDEDIMEEDHALISSDVLTMRFKCHFLRYNSSTLRSHKINNFYRRKLKVWNCVFQTLHNFHIMWKKISLPRHYKHKCKFVHSGKNKIGFFSFCLECCCWCFFFLVNTR